MIKKYQQPLESSDNERLLSTIEGWCIQLKHGHSKPVYLKLVDKQLLCFRDVDQSQPYATYDLAEYSVSELQTSDSEENGDSATDTGFGSLSAADEPIIGGSSLKCEVSAVLRPRPGSRGTGAAVFLQFDRKQDASLWMYHLALAADVHGCHLAGIGTPFETLVSSMMRSTSDGELNAIWKHPLLNASRESIEKPLTTLKNSALNNEALKLFKSIQLFTMVAISPISSGIEYHVTLAQSTLDTCYEHVSLQDELFAQLVKQSSTAELKSGSSKDTHHRTVGARYPCTNQSQKQAFQLLSLACSAFLPHAKVLWLLRQHLRRYAGHIQDQPTNECIQYAAYCERALERTLQNGGRELRPSRIEVLSILLRNPYQHSHPHSIPVHFVNDEYLVLGFDGSTTVSEFADACNREAGLRSGAGFALYCDDPRHIESNAGTMEAQPSSASSNVGVWSFGPNVPNYHLLPINAKLADVIARWECLMKTHRHGRFEAKRSPRLMYRTPIIRRSTFKHGSNSERVLAVYQLHEHVRRGLLPVSRPLANQLCALLIRYERAQNKSGMSGNSIGAERLDDAIRAGITKFYPKSFDDKLIAHVLTSELKDALRSLETISAENCIRAYLNCAKHSPLFASQLFQAFLVRVPKWFSRNSCKCWISIDETSIQLLDCETFQPWIRFAHEHLLRYGGHRNGLFQLQVTVATASVTLNRTSPNHHHSDGSFELSGNTHGNDRVTSWRPQRFLFAMDRNKQCELSGLLSDHLIVMHRRSMTDRPDHDDSDIDEIAGSTFGKKLVRRKSSLDSSSAFGGALNSLAANSRQSRLLRAPGTPQMTAKRYSGASSNGNDRNYLSRAGSLDRKLSQYTQNSRHHQHHAMLHQTASSNSNETGALPHTNNTSYAYDDASDGAAAVPVDDYYSEIYSPNKEKRSSAFFASSEIHYGGNSGSSATTTTTTNSDRAPTPPQHACAEWEAQLYRMATQAFVGKREFSFISSKDPNAMVGQHMPSDPISSSVANGLNGTATGDAGLPLFSNVNGRPVRVQSNAESDESSYTTDDEDSFDRPRANRLSSSKNSMDGGSSSGQPAAKCPSLRPLMSADSSFSEDYALPADAVSGTTSFGAISSLSGSKRSNDSKDRRLTKDLSGSDANGSTSVENKDTGDDKCGFLCKLNSRGKWKRRFFVSRNMSLQYFDSESDAARNQKLKGKMQLSVNTQVTKSRHQDAIQISERSIKKGRESIEVWLLTGETVAATDEWLRHLKSLLKRYFDQSARHASASIEGWLTRVHNGKRKRCWAVLFRTQMCFFRYPGAGEPSARLELTGTNVSSVQASDTESGPESIDRPMATNRFDIDRPKFRSAINFSAYDEERSTPVLQLVSAHESIDPTYIQFDNTDDLDLWNFYISAAATGHPIEGTLFEQALTKLLELESIENDQIEFDRHPLWNDSALLFNRDSTETMDRSLTTLPTTDLIQAAQQLYRSNRMFTTVELQQEAIEYHVALAQTSLQQVLERPQMTNELYAQLLQLSTGHLKWAPIDCSRGARVDRSSMQALQLLALACSLCLPTGKLLWYLRHHLRRLIAANATNELAQYATYCERAVERCLCNGFRFQRPSRLEVLGVLTRNPNQHSNPHSIPVHLADHGYEVIGFDGSTTVEELITSACDQIGVRTSRIGWFGLWASDPLETGKTQPGQNRTQPHLLRPFQKVTDLLSNWEQVYKQAHLGRHDSNATVRFELRHRWIGKLLRPLDSDRERRLIAYEMMNNVSSGRFPVTIDMCLQFSALLAHHELDTQSKVSGLGNNGNEVDFDSMNQAFERFVPNVLHNRPQSDQFRLAFERKCRDLSDSGCSKLDSIRVFLNSFKKWSFYTHRLFACKTLKPIAIELSASRFKMSINTR